MIVLALQLDSDSDAIREFFYKAADQTLVIVFTSGAVYMYRDVPRDVIGGFVGAESLGRYYNENIKGSYSGDVITSRTV